jgi:hypothetical protein
MLGWCGIDIETYYPWPDQADVPQPQTKTVAQLGAMQRQGKAHQWAKDSRRCALRFIAVNYQDRVYIHDYLASPQLPSWLLDLLGGCVLIGHNIDFDAFVLRRYMITLSPTWIDTMLAARLLGLGKERGSRDAIEEEWDDVDEAGLYGEQPCGAAPAVDDPSDNSLGMVRRRYLGIDLPKDQGSTDWSGTSAPEQLAYLCNDVLHGCPCGTSCTRG